jgi:hypothetical protein
MGKIPRHLEADRIVGGVTILLKGHDDLKDSHRGWTMCG